MTRFTNGAPARRRWLHGLILCVVALCAATSCQEIRDKRVALTQDQWRRVRKNISTERPNPQVEIGAVFGLNGMPLIELVGYSLEGDAMITAKPFKLTWHWKALADIDEDWKVFVHLTPERGGSFQNLDHHPFETEGPFRTSAWEPNTYLSDLQQPTLKADFPSGKALLNIGFFNEQTGKRLDILDPGKGTASAAPDLGKLFVGTLMARNDKFMTLYKVAEPPTIDGALDEPFWKQPGSGRSGRFVNAVNGQNVSTTAEAFGVYTDDSIYFAFDVKDQDLRATFTNRDDHLWEQDCIEIYLNPEGDDATYWELQFSPGEGPGEGLNIKTPIFDAFFEKHRTPHWERGKLATLQGLEAAVVRKGTLNSNENPRDTGYTLEVKIPFASLGQVDGALDVIRLPSIPPKQGDTWRVNFFHVDLSGEPKQGNGPSFAAWSAAGGDFHNLGAFGTVAFGGPPPAPPAKTDATPLSKDPKNPPRNDPKAAVNLPPLTAGMSSAGRRILSLPEEFNQNRNHYFFPCLPTPLPTPSGLQSLTIKAKVDETGQIVLVERSGGPLIDEAVTSCITEKIRGWKVSMRPTPATPNPSATPPLATDLQFQLFVRYDAARLAPSAPPAKDPTPPNPTPPNPTPPNPTPPNPTPPNPTPPNPTPPNPTPP